MFDLGSTHKTNKRNPMKLIRMKKLSSLVAAAGLLALFPNAFASPVVPSDVFLFDGNPVPLRGLFTGTVIAGGYVTEADELAHPNEIWLTPLPGNPSTIATAFTEG